MADRAPGPVSEAIQRVHEVGPISSKGEAEIDQETLREVTIDNRLEKICSELGQIRFLLACMVGVDPGEEGS